MKITIRQTFRLICLLGFVQIVYYGSKYFAQFYRTASPATPSNLGIYEYLAQFSQDAGPATPSIANQQWFYNQDIAQYSTYVIKNATHTWIEALVLVGYSGKDSSLTSNDLVCLIRVENTNEIVEFNLTALKNAYFGYPRKAIVLLEDRKFHETDLSVAVMRKAHNSSHEYLNFQATGKLTVQEPRTKAIAQCIAHVRHFTDTHKKFLKMQQNFGIKEFILHDSTRNQDLTKFLQNNPEYEFVTLRQYNQNPATICNRSVAGMLNRADVNRTHVARFNEMCLQYTRTYIDVPTWNHEELSLNDCYITLGYTYEFVAVYDLDEFVFPRTQSPQTSESQVCDMTSACQKTSFGTSHYAYIKSIVNNHWHTDDHSKLGSVCFSHVAMLTPDIAQKILKSLKGLVGQLKANGSTVLYPFVHDVDATVSFQIDKGDENYLDYLVGFNDQVQCLFSKMNGSKTIADEHKRYMYHLLPSNYRFGKCIHYTKNVAMLFGHWGYGVTGKSISANFTNGEFLAHFRPSLSNYYYEHQNNEKLITPIKSLNFDIEFVNFMVKTYTNSCTN
jgi:hypothetical protein